MIDRFRRWLTRCLPPTTPPDPNLRSHLRDARAWGVTQQREAYQSIRSMREGYTGNFAEEDIFATRHRRETRP